ncbi:MAG: PilZ domain-containing protein [Myxococcales bacterium]|nr:PilZ domain-containing protein [Myxococcales bacterium]
MSDTTLLTSEQRTDPRVAFDALAVLSRDGARIGDFRVENLSAGGAYVTGQSLPPPIGEPVDVRRRVGGWASGSSSAGLHLTSRI